MVTRIGGLASGMDIDSIVEKLMSAEKAPLNKLYQQQQKYEWERDAYREINTALSSFDDYLFDNYRLSSNFYKKTVASSNSNLVTATATSAATGSLSIEGVSQLASSWQGVGKQINATTSTLMNQLEEPLTSPTKLSINAIQPDGKLSSKSTEITINPTDSISDVISRINSSSAGVTAIFENGKLSITANNTGSSAEGKSVEFTDSSNVLGKLGFNIDGTNDTVIKEAKNAVFKINGIPTERTSNTFSLNGYSVTLNSTFNTNETVSNYKEAAQTNYENALLNLEKFGIDTSLSHDQILINLDNLITTAKSELNDAKDALENAKSQLLLPSNLKDTYDGLKEETKAFLKNLSDEQITNLNQEGWDASSVDTTLFDDTEIATLQSLDSDDKITLTSITDEAILNQIKSPKTAGDVYSTLTTTTKSFLGNLTSEQQEELSELDLENLSETVPTELTTVFTEEQWSKLKSLTEKDRKAINQYSDGELGLIKNIKLTEDTVTKETKELNELSSARTQYLNSYETNETAKTMTGVVGETSVAPVSLTSATNVDDMVDKIKKFVETYNGLVTTINGKLKESYDRNYPPLTDEQKEDMSEDEIEKWEAKAKNGLLRNDSILTNGLYGMRNTFMNSVGGLGDATIDSLAEIGITTSSTTSDGGKLVIDEDKLRTAIEKDADQVAAIFTNTGAVSKDTATGKTVDTRGIAQRLRDELKDFTGQIEKKAGKASATNQTFTIGRRLDEVEDSIDRWLEKLENTESRYWKQFTAMEQAINKANSQSSLFQPTM